MYAGVGYTHQGWLTEDHKHLLDDEASRSSATLGTQRQSVVMTDTTHRWDFFLAHASPDIAAAEALYDHLAPAARVFLDSKCLKLGDDWDVELATAQRTSKVTVVLVSRCTQDAYYEREEIASAISLARRDKTNHRVVPLVLKDGKNDVAMPYGLSIKHGLQVSELSELRGAAEKLLKLLTELNEIDLEFVSTSTRIVARPEVTSVSLAELAQGTSFAAGSINSFASAIENAINSGFRIIDRIKARQEKKRLTKLLHELQFLEFNQAPLPWIIRVYWITQIRIHGTK
ncbi:MAG TPA: TIR domain-containing protein [Candidatus Saccharimonadales bacterium]|nr:TIR domain-containing protein [Candidatus Saccharimonadales bacterium]